MAIIPNPNLQLIYVSDIKQSTDFYASLYKSDPIFKSSRYVAFSAGEKALFAIWSGGITPDITKPRYSEIGIMLHSDEDVDRLYNEWLRELEVEIVQEPCTEVFGRTFLAKDPDGHIIRVCSLD